MSKTTVALEALVASVIANRPAEGMKPSVRQRHNVDKAFASILKLIAPRIRHFIRQYGLAAYWEDAEQAAAIAVHRAIEAYEPEKAQFTTFVNWQIRGEMQSLRFRLMTDQRSSAKKVEATTVSIHNIAYGADGDEGAIEAIIADEDALERVEAGASAYLAQAATAALVEEYIEHLRTVGLEQLRKRPRAKRVIATQPGALRDNVPSRVPARLRGIEPEELEKLEAKLARNRAIVERRVFDVATLDELGADTGLTKERVRQITKRAAKTIGELTASHPKFAMMAEDRKPTAVAAKPRKKAAKPVEAVEASLLPEVDQPHNRLTRVVAIAPTGPIRAEGDNALDSATDSAVARAAASGEGKSLIH
ncbi:sigma factor-like helix-turn-helix DNA-binding protein [Sphingosinicella sp. LY1275]|uniref:sigma factor-like helix-turn-helix DNA-binding protein n=1 Tax=Sphingosinicella sp. LY1275 TaxID=3095379 RepID=UPI002ADEC5F3|nr:sigma factor-like helix-turn-helix DNA-binding protein [Sphingosinicella sp. LY1275]MEA1013955.1 sigma factor-like helix-turn-helix DNA-binding protein [Sphingosinicella sp. LY1275]